MDATIFGAFIAVWTALLSFMTETVFPALITLFWADNALTFIGVMAVIMAGVALVLLVWNLIRSFFAMHG